MQLIQIINYRIRLREYKYRLKIIPRNLTNIPVFLIWDYAVNKGGNLNTMLIQMIHFTIIACNYPHSHKHKIIPHICHPRLSIFYWIQDNFITSSMQKQKVTTKMAYKFSKTLSWYKFEVLCLLTRHDTRMFCF